VQFVTESCATDSKGQLTRRAGIRAYKDILDGLEIERLLQVARPWRSSNSEAPVQRIRRRGALLKGTGESREAEEGC
jgi:hypothetical protein